VRDDSVGFFWEDLQTREGRTAYARPIPAVPETGWAPPREFPRLADAKRLGLDVETKDPALLTKGPGWRRTGEDGANLVGLSVATEDGQAWYFPIAHEFSPEQNLDRDAVLSWARDNLCTPGQTKVGANLMYDVDALWSSGVPVTGPFIDVQWAEALLDEYRRTYSLDSLAQSYLGTAKVKDTLRDWAVRAYGEENYRANIYRCPPSLVGPYAEGDAGLPLEIYAKQRPMLAELALDTLFDNVETPLLPQLVRMRQRGVRVDVEYAKRLDNELTQAIAVADQRLQAIAGRAIDIGSRTDLIRLFDAAGVPYPRTATGLPSFAKDFLDHCDHPAAALIVERRKLAKYRDTFVRGYVLSLQVNGRLHALFHPLRGDENGTVSGRFSSSLPNLQNIPARDPVWGPKLRALFLPDEGEEWLRHDWSQIEYRFLAHYARGPSGGTARRLYREDPKTDFHVMTQRLIHAETGVELDRKPVKNINFGLCLEAGQRVHTVRGDVPIEDVLPDDLLWDGIDWVAHGGVIFSGHKKVIRYDGISATPGHVVWTDELGEVPLGFAASQGLTLTRPRGPGSPCPGSGDACTSQWVGDTRPRLACLPPCALHEVRDDEVRSPRQLHEAAPLPVPAGEVPRPTGGHPRREVRRDGAAVSPNDPCQRQELQRQGDRGPVQKPRALHSVGSKDLSNVVVQGAGLRQDRQRRALLAEESPACRQVDESPEPVPVYDILDAGPRNRFVCEGVLVHNCYGMGKKKLAHDLGVDAAGGERLFSAYHAGVPFVKATYEAAQSAASLKGHITTVCGRRARFPLFEPVFGGRDDDNPALPEVEAAAKYSGRIRRAFTHKALNRLLQGSAADLMKVAMVELERAGVEQYLGPMLLTCHDETGHSMPSTREGAEAAAEVKRVMETCLELRVPILADQSSGRTWGDCK
jgi:DNA polymerase I-like protein with 3'-5' exonuclease and polymerase domains